MRLRMGAWLGALVLLGSWWLASSNAPPVARQQVPPLAERPTTPTAPRAASFSDRLKRGLQHAPGKPTPRRNPFLFATSEPSVASSSSTAASLVDVPQLPVAPPRPLHVLAGIATTDTPDGPVRTAVISTPNGILLLKIDEATPTGMRVVRIAEDHVVLADAEGNETTLRLK